jgi:hypothetical protein
MFVAADSGSIYEPNPYVTYQYDPDAVPKYMSDVTRVPTGTGRPRRPSLITYELAAHPADLSTTTTARSRSFHDKVGPRNVVKRAEGQELWVYQGNAK